MNTRTVLAALIVFCSVASFERMACAADPVEDFYRGKVATVLIGVSVGGEYDLHGWRGGIVNFATGIVSQTADECASAAMCFRMIGISRGP